MSKTVPVVRGDDLLWAYDVSFAILLLEAVRVAEETPVHAPWFAEALHRLRVHATVGASFAFDLDRQGNDGERAAVLRWLAAASARLRGRGRITADQAHERYVDVDGQPIHLRGADEIDLAVVARLGDALGQFARGDLPAAPLGHSWYYGVPTGLTTIGRRG